MTTGGRCFTSYPPFLIHSPLPKWFSLLTKQLKLIDIFGIIFIGYI